MIGHKSRQGKNSFAQFMMKHADGPVERLQTSDSMKDILADMFGIGRERLESLKNSGDPMRGYHQRFGSGKMKELFGDAVWVNLLKNKIIDKETLYIIDDFRFPIEHLEGSTTIKVCRPLSNVKLFDHEHTSETALNYFPFDYVVMNSSSLEMLEQSAVTILDAIGRRCVDS